MFKTNVTLMLKNNVILFINFILYKYTINVKQIKSNK
jgi:hypothetical protein